MLVRPTMSRRRIKYLMSIVSVNKGITVTIYCVLRRVLYYSNELLNTY